MPETRVAVYARVSTLNGQDPEMQLRELREYAARRACEPPVGARQCRGGDTDRKNSAMN